MPNSVTMYYVVFVNVLAEIVPCFERKFRKKAAYGRGALAYNDAGTFGGWINFVARRNWAQNINFVSQFEYNSCMVVNDSGRATNGPGISANVQDFHGAK